MSEEVYVKEIFAVIAAAVLILFVACGSGDEKAETTQKFMDSILKEGDLNTAYGLLSAGDKAMLAMVPGLKDFLAGKYNDEMPEEMKLVSSLLDELTPIPENLLRYEIGQAYGSSDTAYVPVTFSVIKDDPEEVIRGNIDEDLRTRLDLLEDGFEELTFDEKKAIISQAIDSFKKNIQGKSFAMESQTQEFTLIKENGKWRVSLVGALMSQAFSMQQPQ